MICLHLSIENLRELAQAYYKEQLLSDKQLEYKEHMAECDVCYEKFCAEYVIQKTLIDCGLMSPSVLEELSVLKETFSTVKEIKCKIVNEINGLKKVVEEKGEQISGLWNFYPAPQLAVSRGQEISQESEIMENEASDYSYIEKTPEGILFRLDATDFNTSNLRLIYIADEVCSSFPFLYNEKHGSYDARIDGKIPLGAEFQIVEVLDED